MICKPCKPEFHWTWNKDNISAVETEKLYWFWENLWSFWTWWQQQVSEKLGRGHVSPCVHHLWELRRPEDFSCSTIYRIFFCFQRPNGLHCRQATSSPRLLYFRRIHIHHILFLSPVTWAFGTACYFTQSFVFHIAVYFFLYFLSYTFFACWTSWKVYQPNSRMVYGRRSCFFLWFGNETTRVKLQKWKFVVPKKHFSSDECTEMTVSAALTEILSVPYLKKIFKLGHPSQFSHSDLGLL